MPVVSTIGAMSARGFGEFNQQARAKYIENYFSSYLYTGNGTFQIINNGVPLSNTFDWYTYTFTQSQFQTANSARGVAIDSSNNFYVAGTAYDGSNFYIILLKYNSSGVLQWQRKLQENNSSNGCVIVDLDGNPYVAGVANDGTRDYGIISKYNSSGALQWQRKLSNPTGTVSLIGITKDSSNNIFVTGSYVDGSNNYLILAKYNSSGTIQWQRQFYAQSGSSFVGRGLSVATDSLNNVYVAGSFPILGTQNAILVKYDSSGAIQWQKKFVYGSSTARGVTVDSLDNIYFVLNNSSVSSNFVLVKCNSSGVVQWNVQLSDVSAGTADIFGVTTDSFGNIYVSAELCDATTNQYMIVAKYDNSGALQWQRKITKTLSGGAVGYGVAVNSAGHVYSVGKVPEAAFTVRLEADGTTLSGTAYVSMLPGSATSSVPSITVSDAGGFDISGQASESAGTANDSSASAVTNIYSQEPVSNSGGLVWIKSRSNALNNNLYDTEMGENNLLVSNSTAAKTTQTTSLTNFSASGFAIGSFAAINTNANTFVSWTFRKSSRFFDVIKYTGTGSVQTISHGLGSVPGMIIVKRTDTTGNWAVYHSSIPNTSVIFFNTTGAATSSATYWSNTSPTDKVFTVGTNSDVNAINGNYVAYLFASDAGGFGIDSGQNVIACGSYTGNGSTAGPSVFLGYEPQFLIIKAAGAAGNWNVIDTMRGMAVYNSDAVLSSNVNSAEYASSVVNPTSTGFSIATTSSAFNSSGIQYIYMAIRRGPMAIPASGTSVFLPKTQSNPTGTVSTTDFVVDSQWKFIRAGNALNTAFDDRLRGVSTTSSGSGQYVITSSTSAQATSSATTLSWNNIGYSIPSYYNNLSSVFYNFQRAPNFMDVVCYDGSASATTIIHNLRAVPELMIVKRVNGTGSWYVYHSALGNTKYAVMETTAAPVTSISAWNNTTPTTGSFTIGTNANVNGSGSKFVAYLFASCPNVSKVGTYTGTGSTLTVDCGLASGVRYVMIKRSDGVGDWFFWDTARGMVTGTDPRGAYNLTTAEANADWVYTTATGFQVVSTDATVNASGGTYIYLAIA